MDDPDYDPNLPPSSKRTDSSLKPRRTTRTMNPLTKSTMKHVNMISKTHEGTYQKVISRSASKSIDETMDMEDLEYGEDVPEPDEGSDDLDETCADMNDAVSKVDRELLDDTDSRVAYFSSTFLLKRMMTEEADNYQRGLSSLVSRAQRSNNEKLLENPYLQMRGLLQLSSEGLWN